MNARISSIVQGWLILFFAMFTLPLGAAGISIYPTDLSLTPSTFQINWSTPALSVGVSASVGEAALSSYATTSETQATDAWSSEYLLKNKGRVKTNLYAVNGLTHFGVQTGGSVPTVIRSLDNGKSFQSLRLTNVLPALPDKQVYEKSHAVYYVATRGLYVWLFAHSAASFDNETTLRVASSPDLVNWTLYDISTWGQTDRSTMSATLDYLHISSAYGEDFSYHPYLYRLPLNEMVGGLPLTAHRVSTRYLGENSCSPGVWRYAESLVPLPRVYAASGNCLAPFVDLFSWGDADLFAIKDQVVIDGVQNYGYSCVTPSGINVCDRYWYEGSGELSSIGSGLVVGPITKTDGTIVNSALLFSWLAAQDASHPYPYQVIMRLDATTLQLIDTSAIWSNQNAWFDIRLGVNRYGEVGGVLQGAGALDHPFLAAVFMSGESAQNPEWGGVAHVIRRGDYTPADGNLDFIGLVPDSAESTRWWATGMVQEGGDDLAHRNILRYLISK